MTIYYDPADCSPDPYDPENPHRDQRTLSFETITTVNEITKTISLITKAGITRYRSVSKPIKFPARITNRTYPPGLDPSHHEEWATAVQAVEEGYSCYPAGAKSVLREMFENSADYWCGRYVGERLEYWLDGLLSPGA